MNNSHSTSYKESKAPFDGVAAQYDADFTNTPLGKRKRQIVWNYVTRNIRKDWRVLELNCGTGQDALWLSSNVQHILATDISEGMIAIAEHKVKEHGISNVALRQMAIQELWETPKTKLSVPTERFDLVFSNFDGLNCVQDLSVLPEGLRNVLHPKGEAIFVLMSGFCLMETLGYALRGRFSAASTRFRSDVRAHGLQVNIGGGIAMRTWFHSTGKVLQYFRENGFRVITVRGVGLTTPPTFMRDAYNRHRSLFQRLHGLENALSPLFPFNRMSDHILLHVQRID